MSRLSPFVRKLIGAGIVVSALLLVGLLNPSPTTHRQQIAQTYANENPVTGAIGVGEALGTVASYHDYVFFSTTSLGPKRMSVGAVGVVHATPPNAAELSAFVMERLPPPIRKEILKELPDWMRKKLRPPDREEDH
jgi:hypothetical protein